MRLHCGFPARYTTDVKTVMQCYIPAANATAAAGNYFAIAANSLYQPFATTYNMTTGTGTASYAFNGSLVNGFTISDSPMFFVELATLYKYYRVLRYHVKVTLRSTSTADVFTAVLFPLGNEIIPSTSASAVDVRVFGSQPRAVTKEIATGMSATSLELGQAAWDLLEMRRSVYVDTVASLMSAQPTGTGAQSMIGYVGFFLQMATAAANAGAVSVIAELIQEVECFDLLQPLS